MTFLPSQWAPSRFDNDAFVYDSTRWVIHAEKSWSFSSPDNNTMRFEVRSGDRFSSNNWTDPQGSERAEIFDTAKYSTSNQITIDYQFMIEPGATNTARWLVMGQLHSNTNASPPIEVKLEGNDKMVIYGNYGSASNPTYHKIFQDSANIQRGKWYTMKLEIKLDAGGNGYADIWRDGQQIVNYNGKLGYSGQTQTYWREGVYRSSASETIAINYKNLDISVGQNIHNLPDGPIGTPNPTPAPTPTPTPTPTPVPGVPGQVFVGGWANNTMYGTSGNDTFYGRDGDDLIVGKQGNDLLYGEAGRDMFVFDVTPGTSNIDRIADFNVNEDRIHLENAIFTKLTAGNLPSSAFVIGSRAYDANDRIIYDNKTGILSYDADGSGAAAATQIASLATGLNMTASQFYVI